MPLQKATDPDKRAARTAVQTINDEGSTCVSCGLATGAYERTHSPVPNGLRRILLTPSYGPATASTVDRDELTTLAAARGPLAVSISVGVGCDERTMRASPRWGHPNCDFVEDTVARSELFLRELATWSQTAASNVVARGSGQVREFGFRRHMATRSSTGATARSARSLFPGSSFAGVDRMAQRSPCRCPGRCRRRSVGHRGERRSRYRASDRACALGART
jgi:hypothetical protein